ncbi:ribonuclease T [Pseudofulvimonas gallinarii]|nr:ribonuclease T [Pseudofulvimonas gallinarii]
MDGQPASRGTIAERFRGFLPVVVDVETGGFEPDRHALLEIAVAPVTMDAEGLLQPGPITSTHVIPYEGGELDPRSLAVNGIDPHHPLRAARHERQALDFVFKPVRAALSESGCQRAILVGHNAHFDLAFINAAIRRIGYKRNPFHNFSVLDTASLAGLVYGQTVLSRALQAAGLEWNGHDAHSARYDVERTSELFCTMVNTWKAHGGWRG